jgi:hypothetical protein
MAIVFKTDFIGIQYTAEIRMRGHMAICVTAIGRESEPYLELIDNKKTMGRKSRGTVPLREYYFTVILYCTSDSVKTDNIFGFIPCS